MRDRGGERRACPPEGGCELDRAEDLADEAPTWQRLRGHRREQRTAQPVAGRRELGPNSVESTRDERIRHGDAELEREEEREPGTSGGGGREHSVGTGLAHDEDDRHHPDERHHDCADRSNAHGSSSDVERPHQVAL